MFAPIHNFFEIIHETLKHHWVFADIPKVVLVDRWG